jgi:hypothetical protein
VIPARFADGAAPSLSSGDIAAQLFSGAGGGPVTDAFALASGHGFTLRGQVTNWVTTSVTIEGFTQPGGPGQESGLGLYIKDAIRMVDGDINFGLYDNDGRDGKPDSGDDCWSMVVARLVWLLGGCGRCPNVGHVYPLRVGGAQ